MLNRLKQLSGNIKNESKNQHYTLLTSDKNQTFESGTEGIICSKQDV